MMATGASRSTTTCGSTPTPGWQTFDIPCDTYMRMAMGISLGVSFGVEPLGHGFDVISVGCEFV